MTARANVDARHDQLIVASYSKSVAGYWVMNGWYRILDREVDDATLGLAVFDALARSDTAAPALPPEGPLPIAPLVAALHLKTYAQYIRGVRSVGIRGNGAIEITPTRNDGTRRGFTPIESATVTINTPDNRELGHAVRQALELTL